MSATQRVLLIAACFTSAAVLHTFLCEWTMRSPNGVAHDLFVVHESETNVDRPFGWRPASRGLVAQQGVEKSDALVYGVVLPLLLVTAGCFLALEWRRFHRLQRGRCTKCGYDRKADYTGTCPECGWRPRLRVVAAG